MAVNKPIQFKRSNIAGKVPTVSQLLAGELALNTADKVFYTKDATGAIVRMSPDIVAPLSLTYAKTDAHVLIEIIWNCGYWKYWKYRFQKGSAICICTC